MTANSTRTSNKSEGAPKRSSPMKKTKSSKKEKMFGIRFTHPDKVMFPEHHITKANLGQYYLDIERYIKPYFESRPLTLVRCIKGVGDRQFVQKHMMKGMPEEGMKQVSLKEKNGKTDTYMVAEKALGLVGAVQMDTLEFFTWQSTVDDPNHPDQLVLDLDPGDDVSFDKIKNVATCIRGILKDVLEMKPLCMLTGSKGLHIVAPLKPKYTFERVRELAHAIAELAERRTEGLATVSPRKNKRQGHVYVDYVTNSYNQSSVMPYSTRARPGAPVACPVTWEELKDIDKSAMFDVESIRDRLEEKGDVWPKLDTLQASIPDDWSKRLKEASDVKTEDD
eukprot:TRINITY_DN9740_c0_g1_i1.p1 TRINITY_DN9740_c0_g1~~TRINITY_DN9740_c0_g1_i1.p1  ORF type:complete len:337 (+),score=72.21 TRINITY_DN9740_c0_g1_i1:67-1077(+)